MINNILLNSKTVSKIGIGLATAIAATVFVPTSAEAISLFFSTTDFNISQGTGSNTAGPGIAINQNSPPDGFGSGSSGFFTEQFVLLGATPTNTSILNSDGTNNTQANSSTFTFTQADVEQDLVVTFNWAFQGNSVGGASDADEFNIGIVTLDPNALDATVFRRTTNPGDSIPGYGSGSETITIAANTFTPNTQYFFAISVAEGTDPSRNSAAGFNQISLNSVPVPFEFSPSTGLVLLGGVWGGSIFLKRRKARS